MYSVGPNFTGHDDEPIDDEDIAKFYDDVTENILPGDLVRAARQEEIKSLRSNIAVRSRLVGREFRWKGPFMQGTFAATPRLESLRYVLQTC